MRVYEAIVRGLEGLGVDTAFGGAGENDASLMLALKHSRKIRGVITRHEQAASFMACGYAMYTDRLGVCFATAGPGAFNLFSGLAVAMSDSYPVLAISGYSSVEWTGKGALNETSGVNRTPDSRAMFAATTKKSFFLERISDTSNLLEEAVNLAFEGRPGPVHLHVPENLAHPGASVENYRDIRLAILPVAPDPARVAEVAGALLRALGENKRILLLAGFGAIRSGATEVITEFIEYFQIPLVTTLDGKGIVAEDHRLAMGVFCDSGHSRAWKAFREADIVLAVGNSFAQHATFNFRPDLFLGKTLVHINIDRGEIGKVYSAEHWIVADATKAVTALYNEMSSARGPVAPSRTPKPEHSPEHIIDLTEHIHPGKLAQAISRLLPRNGIVLADAGAHAAWLGYYLELSKGQRFRKPGSFGPMAGHVNGALGLKRAHPDRTVVVGCGDGGYLLSGFELLTAVEYAIPVIWVIFNDGEFKLIKLYQVTTYGESGLVDFKNPDYVAYATACGALGFRVDSIEEFESAFARAISSGRPTVIDAAITRFAIPHYSSSPDGVIAGIVETIANRLKGTR
jgi:acetolactate synthase I/II/III large subunit